MAEPKKKQKSWKDRPTACVIENCGRAVLALGLCESHYNIAREAERRAVEDGTLTPIGKGGRVKGGPGADLGGMQCTVAETAGVLQCSEETLRNFFKANENAALAYREGKESGKASLRRMQYVMAKRSAAMGIWLGKNWLGQRDSLEIGPIGGAGASAELGSEEGATALLRAVRMEKE
jgi:hypothetical protein